MIPTFFGLVIGLVGLVLLLGGSVPAMFALVMACGLMSGSATVIMTALGGSSIPPAHFALVFLVLRLFLPGSGQRPLIAAALRANVLLVIYVLYGVLMAFVGPRLFMGQIDVVPMRPMAHTLYVTSPLGPTSQNITTAVYMVGTLLATIAAYVTARHPQGPGAIVRTAVVVAWIHIVLGVSGVLLKGTAWADVLNLFRNGSYAQLSQNFGGLVRMNGIMAEPSVYAGFGLAWFIFLFECWYRQVLPRRTGPVVFALGLTLLASTSSTAYVGLAGYGGLLLLRLLFVPQAVESGKLIRLLLSLVVAVTLVTILFAVRPQLAAEFGDMIVAMTFGKQTSDSGVQRTLWALQGLSAFAASYGLGVGPGSFRSSSLITAVIGSVGIVGSILLPAFLVQVLKPLRASSYARQPDAATNIGIAASWAAIGLLLPASLISPSPDPGTDFAIFAGIALALRRRAPAPLLLRDRADAPLAAPLPARAAAGAQ